MHELDEELIEANAALQKAENELTETLENTSDPVKFQNLARFAVGEAEVG